MTYQIRHKRCGRIIADCRCDATATPRLALLTKPSFVRFFRSIQRSAK